MITTSIYTNFIKYDTTFVWQICERIRVNGWRVVRDPGGRIGPYATRDDQWVSFDDDFMTRHKAEYARAMELGGNMVWALDLDDFTGQYCGCGKNPLLRSINHVLRGKQPPPPCALQEGQSFYEYDCCMHTIQMKMVIY